MERQTKTVVVMERDVLAFAMEAGTRSADLANKRGHSPG
jgi:hypothetical protein